MLSAPKRTSEASELDRLLEGFQDIPTIPEVLIRIWQLLDDPRSSARDLEEVVALEPPLAAKVLRLANSPYYGGRGRIRDVRMAITTLGFDTLRNLAVCLSVASRLVGRPGEDRVLDHKELWRHSVATAVLARRLGQDLGLCSSDEAFTGGLLHDIGRFVISLGRPGAYAEVVRRAASAEEALSLEEEERAVLGFDHAAVGAAFARRWNFPDALVRIIRAHHGHVTRIMGDGIMSVFGALKQNPWHALDAVEAAGRWPPRDVGRSARRPTPVPGGERPWQQHRSPHCATS